jgi:hypothetical protein
MGSTPVGGGGPSPISFSQFCDVFLGFSSSFQSSEGLAPFVRRTRVLRAHFNRRHSAAGFEMGGSEGASSRPGS